MKNKKIIAARIIFATVAAQFEATVYAHNETTPFVLLNSPILVNDFICSLVEMGVKRTLIHTSPISDLIEVSL
jgi:hypothetical protein